MLGSQTGARDSSVPSVDAGLLQRFRARGLDDWGPALLLLALGIGVLVARGPLPVDETRYLEVAREFRFGEPFNLHLNGAPYAHKPPLAFWIAGALHALGLPLELALRLVPVVAGAGTAWLVSRLGRRLGVRAAGWVFASMLLPLAYAQLLLIDPLLSFAIWACLDAWSSGRDGRAALAAGLAFLAKGPVAAVFLLPLGIALAGRRAQHGRPTLLVVGALGLAASAWHLQVVLAALAASLGEAARPTIVLAWSLWTCALLAWAVAAGPGRRFAIAALPLVLLLGALAMAAWALESCVRGGAAYAEDLLVHQTRDRLSESFAHSRPALYYVPVLLLGALPATPAAWFARPTGVLRRLALAGGVSVGALMLIDGKQPHYLLPLLPALALLLAQAIEVRPRALVLWRAGAVGVLGLLLLAWLGAQALCASGLGAKRFGALPDELLHSPAWWTVCVVSVSGGASALTLLLRSSRAVPTLVAAFVGGLAAILLPAHYALDRSSTPRELREVLREQPTRPVAVYCCFQGGYFNWLSGREFLARVDDLDALKAWCSLHRDGLVICREIGDQPLGAGLVDRYRGRTINLLPASMSCAAGAGP